MGARVLLLVIDMQYDFCSPEGSLYVPGSENDVSRLAKFIRRNDSEINQIIFTQDNHNVIDISHPGFWEDKRGVSPGPYTEINMKKILGGIWRPRFQRGKAVEYIRKLEKLGEFPHVVWPEHCIIGSHGAAIVDEIIEPAKDWARKGRFYQVVIKGTNPMTEHFGALKASVPVPGCQETYLNTELVNTLIGAGKVYIAGEAKSHCVATTIKQMLNLGGLTKKLHILEDCMSDVPGFEKIATSIYEKARLEGARFVKSTDPL